MGNVLIVANRTVGSPALAAVVAERVGDGGCVAHLVVPVPSPVASAVAVGATAPDMAASVCRDVEADRRAAGEQLEFGLRWLGELGVTATGELTYDSDTATAVARLVDAGSFDEVIVSTLPSKVSRWLRQDLPRRLQRRVTIPVVVVSGTG